MAKIRKSISTIVQTVKLRNLHFIFRDLIANRKILNSYGNINLVCTKFLNFLFFKNNLVIVLFPFYIMYCITLHLFLIILIIIFLARQLEHGLSLPDFPQQPVVQVPVQHLQN
jgi:hypothetical protein